MTKEEILAMEPGIELDKLVAILMGKDLCWRMQEDDGENMPGVWYLEKDGSWAYWSPSTDISVAFQVVGKLIEQNLFRSLDYLYTKHWRDGKGDWRCRVVCGVKIEFAVAREAPEAICKAALLTKHSN